MKKLLTFILIFISSFILIVSNPFASTSASAYSFPKSLNIYIEDAHNDFNLLYNYGKIAYDLKLTNGNTEDIIKSINNEIDRINKLRIELFNGQHDSTISEVDRKTSLYIIIVEDYYKLAYEQLISFLNTSSAKNSYSYLYSYYANSILGYQALQNIIVQTS